MTDPVVYTVHTPDEYDRATRLRVDAGQIMANAVSGATVRTSPDTLIKWIDQVYHYLDTGALK